MMMRLRRRKCEDKSKNSDNYFYYLDISDYCDETMPGLPPPEPVTAYVSGKEGYREGGSFFKVSYILELSALSAKDFPNEQLPDFFNSQLIVGSTKDNPSARVFQNLSTLEDGHYVVERCEFEQRSDVSGSVQMRRNEEGVYERYTPPIEYGPKKTTFLLSPKQYDSQYFSPGDHVGSLRDETCLLHVQDGNFSLHKITAVRRNFDTINDGIFASANVGKAYSQIQLDERKAAERKAEEQLQQRKAEQAASNKAAFFNKETAGAATSNTTPTARAVPKPDNGCCPIL